MRGTTFGLYVRNKDSVLDIRGIKPLLNQLHLEGVSSTADSACYFITSLRQEQRLRAGYARQPNKTSGAGWQSPSVRSRLDREFSVHATRITLFV